MFLFSPDIYLGMGLLDSMATLFLTFCGTARLFFKVILEFTYDFNFNLLFNCAACLSHTGWQKRKIHCHPLANKDFEIPKALMEDAISALSELT